MHIERILHVVLEHPLGHNRPATRHDAHDALHRQGNMTEQKPRVQRHEIDTLLGLRADYVEQKRRIHLRNVPFEARYGLVYRHGSQRRAAVVEHALADCLQVVGSDRQVHHEIGLAIQRNLKLLQLVAFARMSYATPEIGVNLGREHPPDPNGAGVAMVDVEWNHRLAAGYRLAYGVLIHIFVRSHNLHGCGHNALAGRLQLRHLFLPSPALSGSGSRVSSQPPGTTPGQHPVGRYYTISIRQSACNLRS